MLTTSHYILIFFLLIIFIILLYLLFICPEKLIDLLERLRLSKLNRGKYINLLINVLFIKS